MAAAWSGDLVTSPKRSDERSRAKAVHRRGLGIRAQRPWSLWSHDGNEGAEVGDEEGDRTGGEVEDARHADLTSPVDEYLPAPLDGMGVVASAASLPGRTKIIERFKHASKRREADPARKQLERVVAKHNNTQDAARCRHDWR